MKFEATDIGFEDGLGGASNALNEKEYHYVIFGAQEDKQHPEYNGIYFEYDDQINGGVNTVSYISIRSQEVEFVLKDGTNILVDGSKCKDKWDIFVTEIRKTFPKELVDLL